MDESFINELRKTRDVKASEQRRKREEAQGLILSEYSRQQEEQEEDVPAQTSLRELQTDRQK